MRLGIVQPRDGFQVIASDPPWRFSDGGSRMAPDHRGRGARLAKYATMTTDAICELEVERVAAINAWLFLWAPNALVLDGQATRVARAWGFEPKQLVPWIKTDAAGRARLGGGHYTRVVSEMLLVCTRGRVKPARRDLAGVLSSPRGHHSAKPDDSYELIEQLTGAPVYLEMFARRRWSHRWHTWGKQAPR